MPLDVLRQLEEARKANVSDEILTSSIDNIMEQAKNSTEAMVALREIINSLTASGQKLSDSLVKVVFYFKAYKDRVDAASKSSIELMNVYEGMGSEVPEHLGKVYQALKDIHELQTTIITDLKKSSVTSNLVDVRGLKSSLAEAEKAYQAFRKNTSNVGKPVAPRRNPAQPENYPVDEGGGVTQRTQKVQDKQEKQKPPPVKEKSMADINLDKVTQPLKEARELSRQRGDDSFVGKIKDIFNYINASGKSLAVVGSQIREEWNEKTQKLKEVINKRKTHAARVDNLSRESLKEPSVEELKMLDKISERGYGEDDLKHVKITDMLATLEESIKETAGDENKRNIQSIANLINTAITYGNKEAIDRVKKFVTRSGYVDKGDISQKKPEDFERDTRLASIMQQQMVAAQKEASGFQAMMRGIDDSVKQVTRQYEDWVGTAPIGLAAVAAATLLVADNVTKLLGKYKSFMEEQAKLNVELAKTQTMFNKFKNVATMDSFRKDLNLTRSQMVDLSDVMFRMGIKSVPTFEHFEAISHNIKNIYGSLDTSLLKEAVELIKDLPEEQVEVLIKGTGELDDNANLLANLMESGRLAQAAELIVKGSFGEIDGVTAQLSEKDRAMYEIQSRIASGVDSIVAGLHEYMPKFVGSSAQIVPGIAAMATTSASTLVSTVATYKALQKYYRGIEKSAAVKYSPIPVSVKDDESVEVGDVGKMSNADKFAALKTASLNVGVAAASALAIAGFAKIASYMSDVGKEWRDARIAAMRESGQRSYEKHGVYLADQEGDFGGRGDYAGAAGRGGAWGVKAGALVGGIVGGIGGFGVATAISAPIGAAIGAGVGLVVGSVVGLQVQLGKDLWNLATKSKLARDTAKMREDTHKMLIDVRDIKARESGYGNAEDMRKVIVQMASIDKRLRMISDGVFTAGKEAQKNLARRNIDAMAIMGGTAGGFGASVDSMMSDVFSTLQTNMNLLRQQEENIMSIADIDPASQMVALSRLREEELNAYEKFNRDLLDSVGQYEKIPSVILSSIRNKVERGSLNFNRKNFVGTTMTAIDSASTLLGNTIAEMGDVLRQTTSEIMRLREDMSRNSEEIKINNDKLTDAETEVGKRLAGVVVSDGDNNRLIGNMRVANDTIVEYDKLMTAAVNKTGQVNVAEVSASLTEMNQAAMEKYMNALGEKMTVSDRMRGRSEIGDMITQQRDLYERIEGDKEYGGDERAAAKNALRLLRDVEKSYEGGDMSQKEIKEAFNALNEMAAHVSASVMRANEGRIAGTAEGRQAVAMKELYVSANKLKAAILSASGAQDRGLATQNAAAEAFSKFLSQWEDSGKNIQEAAERIRDSASVLWANARQSRLEAKKEYSATMLGGVRARDLLTDAEALTLRETSEAVKSAQMNVDQAFADWQSIWAENMALTQQKSPEVAEYINLENRLMRARKASLENPEDDVIAREVVELQAVVNRFSIANRGAIDKFKNENGTLFNTMTAAINNVGSTIDDQTTEMSNLSKNLVEFVREFDRRVGFAVDEDYGYRLGDALTGALEERLGYAEHLSSADDIARVGGESLREIRKLSRMGVDLTKQSVKSELAHVDRMIKDAFGAGDIERATFLQKERQILELRGETKIAEMKKRLRENEQKAVRSYIDALADLTGRREESLNIQKDLLSEIGAPFEYVLQIERDLVQIVREKAELEEQALADMIKSGENSKMIEEQRLKTMRAQAEVIKAAFGAQRDSLDKMIGKIMGSYNKIGGIFGPNSERMLARKYGQGHATTGGRSGMVVRAGNINFGGYAERIFGNTQGIGRHSMMIPGFTGGGEIGGTQSTGDKQLIRVNAREWIWTPEQMDNMVEQLGLKSRAHLFDLASGKLSVGKFTDGGEVEDSYRMGYREARRYKAGKYRKYDYETSQEKFYREQETGRRMREKWGDGAYKSDADRAKHMDGIDKSFAKMSPEDIIKRQDFIAEKLKGEKSLTPAQRKSLEAERQKLESASAYDKLQDAEKDKSEILKWMIKIHDILAKGGGMTPVATSMVATAAKKSDDVTVDSVGGKTGTNVKSADVKNMDDTVHADMTELAPQKLKGDQFDITDAWRSVVADKDIISEKLNARKNNKNYEQKKHEFEGRQTVKRKIAIADELWRAKKEYSNQRLKREEEARQARRKELNKEFGLSDDEPETKRVSRMDKLVAFRKTLSPEMLEKIDAMKDVTTVDSKAEKLSIVKAGPSLSTTSVVGDAVVAAQNANVVETPVQVGDQSGLVGETMQNEVINIALDVNINLNSKLFEGEVVKILKNNASKVVNLGLNANGGA